MLTFQGFPQKMCGVVGSAVRPGGGGGGGSGDGGGSGGSGGVVAV